MGEVHLASVAGGGGEGGSNLTLTRVDGVDRVKGDGHGPPIPSKLGQKYHHD
jgi:hypothetical protein